MIGSFPSPSISPSPNTNTCVVFRATTRRIIPTFIYLHQALTSDCTPCYCQKNPSKNIVLVMVTRFFSCFYIYFLPKTSTCVKFPVTDRKVIQTFTLTCPQNYHVRCISYNCKRSHLDIIFLFSRNIKKGIYFELLQSK